MKNGFPKSRFGKATVMWLCCMALGAWVSSCATKQVRPGLEQYRPRNAEEMRVVQLMLELQRALNAADAAGVLSIYSRDAGIMMDLTGERIGVLLTKEEYAPKLVGKMGKPSFKNCSYLFKFLEPTEFFLDENDAVMTLPLEVDGTRCDYREKAVFSFEFVKTPLGWRIGKSTWEVLESTHPKFKGPGKNR
ncbi:MAG: hypothetical protein JRJ60_22280 [Deltaproteobacteria bacterium]|nr:hypothetical protein [Deltaproteobacteria bacterium]